MTDSILDQAVPRDAAMRLRELGFNCTHVGEAGMSRSADYEILAWSREKNATMVTLDADFTPFSPFPGRQRHL